VLKDDIEGVEGIDLAEEYYKGAVPVIDEMVAKGGRRLGALLNALAAQDAKTTIKIGIADWLINLPWWNFEPFYLAASSYYLI
jgi:hypothetical protein